MAKPIHLARRFDKTWNRLTEAQQERVTEIIVALPDLLKHPHRHSGYGLRQIRGRDYYEVRIDLRWRLIFRVSDDEIVVMDVLNHDQVRRLG